MHRVAWSIAVLLTIALPGTAQTSDPFALENKAGATPPAPSAGDDDPFGLAHRRKDEPASRPAKKNPTDDRIDFEVSVAPSQARPGETVRLTITGIPRRGYHTYPLTQRSADPAQNEAGLSRLLFQDNPALKPLWPVAESKPEFESYPGVGTFLIHKQKFTWTQDILILPDAPPGPQRLDFTIRLQVCNGNCVWGEHPFAPTITVLAGPAAALTPPLQQRLQAKAPGIQVVPIPANLERAETATSVKADTARSDAMGLLTFLLNGALWGAISLLTPCVFPMIPITVSFFLKQSEKQHHRPFTMALIYSLTITTVLTLGGIFLIQYLQRFSQHWVTNSLLGVLFLFFALSLFGMYEIRLPTGLANFTAAREGRGGLVGTMFMALTFTIISFTCVAPFYGGFIALSATAQSATDWFRLALGALAFSATFASPFFVLALFPSMLRTLPKSGSWMNTVKVVMGFLEVAAALKFLRAAELFYFAEAQFLTYDLVLGMYVAISLLCGLYLLNVYRLPHDHEPLEQLSVPRLLFSLLFLSLGLYLLPGMFKNTAGEQQRPNGTVFAWLDSFLLPDVAEAGEGATVQGGGPSESEKGRSSNRLTWIGNLEKGLQVAERQKKLVFIDFTGLT